MTDTTKATPRPWTLHEGQWADHSDDGGGGFHVRMPGFEDHGGPSARYFDYAGNAYPEDADYTEAEANAALIVTAVNVYDAMKAVEAAARTVGDKFDIYVACLLADILEDRPSSPPTDHAHLEVSEAVDELQTALAALDAIRKPDNGKTGEAVI